MKNGWTGGQYSFVRLVLTPFLAAWFLGLAVLWLLFASADAGHDVFDPEFVACAAGVVLTIPFALGWHDRLVALLLLGCLVVVRLSMRSWVAPLPVAESLLAFHLTTPAAPYLTWAARGRADPSGGWRLSAWHVLALRLLLVAGIAMWLFCPGAGSPWPLLAFIPLAFDPGWIPPRGDGGDQLFYDGTCGLCHAGVRLVLAEDRRGTAFRFAPLFGPTFEAELEETQRADLPDSMVVKTKHGEVLTRSDALLHVMRALGGYWRPAAALELLIPRRIRNWQYDQVAKRRKRWFAAPEDACPVTQPEHRSRFDP